MHGEKPNPDFLSDEFASINEASETAEERASLLIDLTYRIFIESGENGQYPAQHIMFIPGTHGELYALPNHKESGIEQLAPNYLLGESLGGNFRKMPSFETRGYITREGNQIVRVDQQSIVQVAANLEHVLYAPLSQCSALIGRNEESLFFGHVGYSEYGNIANVVKALSTKGVSLEKVISIILKPVIHSTNDWHKPATLDLLLDLGLKNENILIASAEPVEEMNGGSELYGYNGMKQVIATPDLVAVRTFDFRNSGKSLVSTTSHDDLRVYEF